MNNKNFCPKCDKLKSAVSKRCQKCYLKINKGKKHSNYKKGKYCKNTKNYCIDCLKKGIKKEITPNAKRCKKCYWKKHSKWMKKNWKSLPQRRKMMNGQAKVKATDIVKHHIDTNKHNWSKKNLLPLTHSKHRKLHHKAYDYLVAVGLIKKYLRWFDKKFGLKEK